MESDLRRRVSTRIALLPPSARQPSTRTPSRHSPSPRPTTPISISLSISPDGPDPHTHESSLISSLRISPNIARMGPLTSPNSCFGPPSSSTHLLGFGDGQFSDADTDEEPAEPRDKKRLKASSFPSTQRDRSSSIDDGQGVLRPSLLPSSSHNRPIVRQEATVQENAQLAGLAKTPSVPPPSTARPGKSQRSSITPQRVLPQKPERSDPESAQLPMATRRLAMLVGIPESSQAIIQSTLSLPPSRSNPPGPTRPNPSSLNCSNTSKTCPRLGPKSSAGTFPSKNGQPSVTSTCPSKIFDSVLRFPSTPCPTVSSSPCKSGAGWAPATPVSSSFAGKCSAKSTSRISPALMAENIDRQLFQSSPCSSQTKAAIDTPPTSAQTPKRDLPAPSYGRSSDSSDQFTMPAPGTFSIRAPSSLQLLRSFDLSTSRKTGEFADWPIDQSAGLLEEGSETDGLSQITVGACPVASPDGSAANTCPTPGASEGKSSGKTKRKPRASKAKSTSQSAQSDNGQPEMELVKPPPTINGKISHGRKVPPGYVKRTPNSFLMFRSHVIANKLLPPGVENDNRQISRVVSGLWAGLSEDDLRTWQAASRELRAAVRAQNPGLKHAPNQKRREVIRRRRTGQLPGETPEQRVVREKAAAAALAKVIIDAHGEKLHKNKLVESPEISLPSSALSVKITSRNSSRDRSLPEFRAPGYQLNTPVVLGQEMVTARSDCAESTLTTSPAAEPLRSLPPLPESEALELSAQEVYSPSNTATASGLSIEELSVGCRSLPDRSPFNQSLAPIPSIQEIKQELNIDPNSQSESVGRPGTLTEATLHQHLMPPPSFNHPCTDSTEISAHQSDPTSHPASFSRVASGGEISQGFSDTFSNEMLRSLGLTASDLELALPTTSTVSIPETPIAEVADSSCNFWSQDTGLDTLSTFSSNIYPFSNLAISEESYSQTTPTRVEHELLTGLNQVPQVESTGLVEFGATVDNTFTHPLGCDILDFDTLLTECASSSMAASLRSDGTCSAFSTNIFGETFESHK